MDETLQLQYEWQMAFRKYIFDFIEQPSKLSSKFLDLDMYQIWFTK